MKFTKGPKTPGITFEKIWFSLKEVSYLQVIFMLLDEMKADMLQFTKKWNWIV